MIITLGLENSLKRMVIETASEGIMTKKTEIACSATAIVMLTPCPASLPFLAILNRPKNRIMRITISKRKARSEVSGAFPWNKTMFQINNHIRYNFFCKKLFEK